MLHRKALIGAAACAALACTGIVRAETPASDPLSLRPAMMDAAPDAAPAAAATTPTLLMGFLDTTPVGKTLDNAGITIQGFVEGGYTLSFQHPPGNFIVGRVFDTKHERIVLDQFDIDMERKVDYAAAAQAHRFDIGGRVEVIDGFDTGLIHSSGLYDNPTTLGVAHGYYRSRTSPENQLDINQLYVDFAVPVGTGMRVRVGKFITPLGAEVINPTGNALYSHSYLFGFAIPFTQTGVVGEYKFSDDWTVDVGITRGWNQTFKDNNGDPDLLLTAAWTPQGSEFLKKWSININLSEGPQTTGDNSDWWTVLDIVAVYKATDALTFTINADYGDAPHGVVPGSAQWYGIAGYAGYKFNNMFTLNGRAEFYDDQDGFTFGTGRAISVFEGTVGVAITPMPDSAVGKNLVIRPEVRADLADHAFFNAGTKHFQATFGIDAYFTF